MAELDEKTVLRRIRRGDGTAFALFYDAFYERCIGYARASTKRDDAFCFDVVQDVMMRVADDPPRLRDAEALEPWLRKAVFSRAIDRLRAEARRRAREEDAAANDAREVREPIQDAIEAEEREWIEAQLACLPALERGLLEARFVDGDTLAESGARVGINVHAAHGKIRRVLLRLRRLAAGASREQT